MRRTSLLILVATTALVAACSTTTPENPVAVTVNSSAPQPVEGYDWFLSEDGTNAKLAYGTADSDDLKLGLECARGEGKLDLTASADKGASPEIYLESGGDTERYAAAAEPAEVHDGLILTAQAEGDAPVFQRFRRIGWLAVWQGGARQTYVPQPGSRDRIQRFFAFCA